MSHSRKILVAITHHNHDVYTDLAIRSLARHTASDYKLVIMDDGSREPYQLPPGEALTNATMFHHSEPKGVIATWNEIVYRWMLETDKDEPQYLVISNNDVIFMKDWDLGLIRAFEDPDCGIAGPMTNAPGHQPLQGSVNPRVTISAFGKMARAGLDKRSFLDVPYVNGFCFMLRKDRTVLKGPPHKRNSKLWSQPTKHTMDTFEGIDGHAHYGGEDIYQARMREEGYHAVVARSSYVYHFKDVSMESHLDGRMGMSLKTLPRRLDESAQEKREPLVGAPSGTD